jgi:hypothetical protein
MELGVIYDQSPVATIASSDLHASMSIHIC